MESYAIMLYRMFRKFHAQANVSIPAWEALPEVTQQSWIELASWLQETEG